MATRVQTVKSVNYYRELPLPFSTATWNERGSSFLSRRAPPSSANIPSPYPSSSSNRTVFPSLNGGPPSSLPLFKIGARTSRSIPNPPSSLNLAKPDPPPSTTSPQPCKMADLQNSSVGMAIVFILARSNVFNLPRPRFSPSFLNRAGGSSRNFENASTRSSSAAANPPTVSLPRKTVPFSLFLLLIRLLFLLAGGDPCFFFRRVSGVDRVREERRERSTARRRDRLGDDRGSAGRRGRGASSSAVERHREQSRSLISSKFVLRFEITIFLSIRRDTSLYFPPSFLIPFFQSIVSTLHARRNCWTNGASKFYCSLFLVQNMYFGETKSFEW